MRPIVTIEAPRTVAMNAGSRLWISSEEMSMNSEPSPRAQMPAGKPRNVAGALRDVSRSTSPPPPLIAPPCVRRARGPHQGPGRSARLVWFVLTALDVGHETAEAVPVWLQRFEDS